EVLHIQAGAIDGEDRQPDVEPAVAVLAGEDPVAPAGVDGAADPLAGDAAAEHLADPPLAERAAADRHRRRQLGRHRELLDQLHRRYRVITWTAIAAESSSSQPPPFWVRATDAPSTCLGPAS